LEGGAFLIRPALLHTLFLILGVVFGRFIGNPVWLSVFAGCLFLLAGFRDKLFPVFLKESVGMNMLQSISSISMWVGVLLFVYGSFHFVSLDRRYEASYLEMAGKEVRGVGVVISEPQVQDLTIRYTLKVETIQAGSVEYGKKKEKILLSIHEPKAMEAFSYGQRIVFKGSLEKPLPKRNPGGLDYTLYLKTRGIAALVYSNSNAVTPLEKNQGHFLLTGGMFLRGKIVETVERYLPKETASLLSAILIGF
jgi:predicted membrane metal-binding protein